MILRIHSVYKQIPNFPQDRIPQDNTPMAQALLPNNAQKNIRAIRHSQLIDLINLYMRLDRLQVQ